METEHEAPPMGWRANIAALTMAVAGAMGLLGYAHYKGAEDASHDAVQAIELNEQSQFANSKLIAQIESRRPLGYTSGGKSIPMPDEPEILISSPTQDVSVLEKRAERHRSRTEELVWQTFGSLVTGSLLMGVQMRPRRREWFITPGYIGTAPPAQTKADLLRGTPVYGLTSVEASNSTMATTLTLVDTKSPPSKPYYPKVATRQLDPPEICPEYIKKFPPCLYYSEHARQADIVVFDQMLERNHEDEPVAWSQQIVRRIRAAMVSRRQKIDAQRKETTLHYDGFATVRNYIEPIAFDRG